MEIINSNRLAAVVELLNYRDLTDNKNLAGFAAWAEYRLAVSATKRMKYAGLELGDKKYERSLIIKNKEGHYDIECHFRTSPRGVSTIFLLSPLHAHGLVKLKKEKRTALLESLYQLYVDKQKNHTKAGPRS